MTSIDPDSEENQAASRQHEREVFALQMQAKQDAESTDQKTRIAIATACGTLDRWLLVKDGWFYRPGSAGYTQEESAAGVWTEAEANKHTLSSGEVTKRRATLPDYTGSLDCMHEAEQTLSSDDQELFNVLLSNITFGHGCTLMSRKELIKLVSATARQRAQAFVRTIAARAERKEKV